MSETVLPGSRRPSFSMRSCSDGYSGVWCHCDDDQHNVLVENVDIATSDQSCYGGRFSMTHKQWLPVYPTLLPMSACKGLPIYSVIHCPSKVGESEHISNDWRATDPHSTYRCVSLPLARVRTHNRPTNETSPSRVDKLSFLFWNCHRKLKQVRREWRRHLGFVEPPSLDRATAVNVNCLTTRRIFPTRSLPDSQPHFNLFSEN